jgi:glucose/arabinose dehydrogenase
MRKLLVLAPLLLFLAISCGGDGNDSNPSPTTAPTGTATTTTVPGANGSESPASGLPSKVTLQRVFGNLTFANLTGLYQTPSGAWLATEKAGLVRLIDASGTQASTFLDITDKVSTAGQEEGLLGLALAPDFATSGVFYVYYSAADPRRSVISRFTSTGNTARPESEQVLLEISQPFSNHNGGQMVFGPDGMLYIGLGDGGSARDPQKNGQNLNTLLGKILRIDVSGGGAYKVPADNPFAGRNDEKGEIWSYGMRNPWRFSFDKSTGDLWVADVGQDTREEIDIVTKGGNYGWSVMEGSQCLGGGSNCDSSGKIPPVFDYANAGNNCSITGGFVYRGSAIEALRGAYVYSDYCSGLIWALRAQNGATTEQAQLADTGFQVSSFAQGNDGELYVLQYGAQGGVYKLAP